MAAKIPHKQKKRSRDLTQPLLDFLQLSQAILAD